MGRWLILLTFTAVTLGLGGCAADDPLNDGRPRETSIPWNRPQSWEGPGVYGSALNPR